MTFKYRTIGGKEDFVHDVISVRRVGQHTYEFEQHGQTGRLRVVEVTDLQCDIRCLCHSSGR